MVTAFYAALLGILFFAMTLFVVRGRFKYKVSLGDGGKPEMQTRVRAHANFAELVPFTVLLLVLAEMQGLPLIAVHVLGGSLVIARLLHPWGLIMKDGASFGRFAGTVVTGLVIVISSGWLLYKVPGMIF